MNGMVTLKNYSITFSNKLVITVKTMYRTLHYIILQIDLILLPKKRIYLLSVSHNTILIT